jgi:hypothetical protein
MAIDGTWNCVMQTPMGPLDVVLVLATQGAELTGTMTGRGQTTNIQDGKADGDKVSWKTAMTTPMPMTLEFTATIAGDELNGNVKLGSFGNAPLKGKRG